ncbi:MAG: hypothetical protein VX938_11180, partial [Myxococcota bacterium]|nr:hypothetical protein [Myxococcota bacterium]
HLPFEGPCEDGNPCTVGEVCDSLGECGQGKATVCDDGDPCSEDACSPGAGGCLHVPILEGMACETPDLCTGAGICTDGTCTDQTPVLCQTDNPCAAALCDPAVGCVEELQLDGSPCDDGDPCTQEGVCTDGVCEVLPLPCNDDNPCTMDSCDPEAGGCVHKATTDGVTCKPDEPCLQPGLCSDGVCEAGAPLACDSGPCEVRACDPLTGSCVLVDVLDDGTPCGTDTGCGLQPVCIAGVCGTDGLDGCDDGNACTIDICDPLTNTCIHEPTVCLAPAGEPCIEATCVADLGCVKAPSPECAIPDDVIWSTSFDCDEDAPWTFSSEGDGPHFQVLESQIGMPDWDEDCTLKLQMDAGNSLEIPSVWTARAESPPFGLPAGSGGDLKVSFMEWWGPGDPEDLLERHIQVVDVQGQILAEAPIMSAPSPGLLWNKTVAELSLTASSSAIRVVVLANGGVFSGAWFLDKLVVTSAAQPEFN